MFWRFFFLFGGIVLMINGCNSLVSGRFGTHRLRTVGVADVADGLGDADYLEVTGATVGPPFIVGPALRDTDEDYVLRPVFTPTQAAGYGRGETVEVDLIVWEETSDPACTAPPGCPPPTGPLRGLLSEPTDRKNPVTDWNAQRIRLSDRVNYLQLYERPLAWYWNLLMLVGGLGLAVGVEAIYHRRAKKQ